MSEMQTVLGAEDLQLAPGSEIISEQVKKQEIVGLAGLDGHGQAQFLEVLAGKRAPVAGRVLAHTDRGPQEITSLSAAARAKVGYLPADRKRNGIFPGLSVLDNFTLGNLAGFSKGGWLKPGKARSALDVYRDELSMTYASTGMHINRLSGGNQQKVLLARSMARHPRVMLLNDPTRGVDIQTRKALYAYLRRAVTERGVTLVILSTELEEILELCDRVIVFRDNGVSARIDRKDMTLDSVMAAMFGQLDTAEGTQQ
ncbi:MAG: ATP-binding cassette domain-containing protein [Alphaproteobacteria bacterium]|nr:ATP-binding cassette domain-containing protein [Alphaproteobacteria bacterium]